MTIVCVCVCVFEYTCPDRESGREILMPVYSHFPASPSLVLVHSNLANYAPSRCNAPFCVMANNQFYLFFIRSFIFDEIERRFE